MDIELLYKKLEGTLTPAEEKEFIQWLNTSATHRTYFELFVKKQHFQLPYSIDERTYEIYRIKYKQKLRKKRVQRNVVRWSISLSGIAALFFVVWFFTHDVPNRAVVSVVPQFITQIDSGFIKIEAPKISNGKVRFTTSTGKTMTLHQLAQLNNSSYIVDSMLTCLSYVKVDPVSSGKELMNEIVVEKGAEFYVLLSDGTRVWLNADSKLRYPEYFIGERRNVYLEGEAYFDVAKDSEHAFVVHTEDIEVRVYGTEFNVNTRDKKCIRTTLVEGYVSVCFCGDNQEIQLAPGYSAEMNEETQTIEMIDKDILLYTGWKNGEYYFENSSLEDLFEEISRWYDVKFEFADEELKSECFTGCIPRKASLRKILNIVLKTNYITFERKGSKIILRDAFE